MNDVLLIISLLPWVSSLLVSCLARNQNEISVEVSSPSSPSADPYPDLADQASPAEDLDALVVKEESFAAEDFSEISAKIGSTPVRVTPEVQRWLSYFKTTGRQTFAQWLQRSEALQGELHPLLKKEKIPVEVMYVAMIESGFNTHTYSVASAAGPWQLVAGTARRYGLTINHWLDERRDPIKSTIAAARYLRTLHQQFGDWHLAFAAYNAGPVRIENAIASKGSRDFWQLCRGKVIKEQTKQFVPKVLAAIIIGSQPRQHGFNLKRKIVESYPRHTVVLEHSVQLRQLAQGLALSLEQLKRWNPELSKEVTPPKANPKAAGYALRLPQTYRAKYEQIKPQLTCVTAKPPKTTKGPTGTTPQKPLKGPHKRRNPRT